jgi:hypothetical protein
MSPFEAGEFTDMDGQPIADAPTPRACPFCGSGAKQLVIDRWSEEDDPDAAWHVVCLKCDCFGPEAATQLEAAQAWNARDAEGR